MSRIHIALFDPSQPAPDGSFWSWRSPALDKRMLDRLYYDVASLVRPDHLDELDGSCVTGGFAKLDPDWTWVFRYGDGGRDVHGRPGRFVLIVAGVPRDASANVDLESILGSQPIIESLRIARSSCPVPTPPSLEFDHSHDVKPAEPALAAKALLEGEIEFTGASAVRDGSAVCAALPKDSLWRCDVRQVGGTQTATLKIIPSPPGKAGVSDAQQPAVGVDTCGRWCLAPRFTQIVTKRRLIAVAAAIAIGALVGKLTQVAPEHPPESVPVPKVEPTKAGVSKKSAKASLETPVGEDTSIPAKDARSAEEQPATP